MQKMKKGFTLIEGVIALAIFILLVSVFYNVFGQSATLLGDVKQRRGAMALAQERMEHYRNFAYDNVEVVTKGGLIVEDETAEVNDTTYRIITSVETIDDPTDGTIADGTDPIWNDYKHVSVTIVWDKCVNMTQYSRGDAEHGAECSQNRVTVMAQFVPPGGLETIGSGGVLSVNVLDHDANPINTARVRIHNRDTGATPYDYAPVHIGNLMYVGAPACEGCYHISARADGYEAITTQQNPASIHIPIIGDVTYHPQYVHQNVNEGDLTTLSFILQKLSTLKITVEDTDGNTDIGGISFFAQGGRVLGTNSHANPAYTMQDVYAFNQKIDLGDDGVKHVRTDTNGDGSITSDDDVNPGVYHASDFDLDTDDDGEDDYVFWKFDVHDGSDPATIAVDPDTDVDAKMILISKHEEGVTFVVEDEEGEPIDEVLVTVFNDNWGCAKVLETDAFGRVFFDAIEVDDDDENAMELYRENLVVGQKYRMLITKDTFADNDFDDQEIEIKDGELIIKDAVLVKVQDD